MATLPGMRERTITISSFGKTFSLTGWKIGWAAAPPPLTAAVRAAHQFITFATATPLQHAAAAALSVGPDYYRDLAASYRRKRDYLVAELSRLGFRVDPPAGTYYVCADFRPLGFDDDVAFCRHLIEKAGVAAIPPSAFYENTRYGKTYARFAFAKGDCPRSRPAFHRLLPSGEGRGEGAAMKRAPVQTDIAEDVPKSPPRRAAAEAAQERASILPEMFSAVFRAPSASRNRREASRNPSSASRRRP
jgi:hypothetical protein